MRAVEGVMERKKWVLRKSEKVEPALVDRLRKRLPKPTGYASTPQARVAPDGERWCNVDRPA